MADTGSAAMFPTTKMVDSLYNYYEQALIYLKISTWCPLCVQMRNISK